MTIMTSLMLLTPRFISQTTVNIIKITMVQSWVRCVGCIRKNHNELGVLGVSEKITMS